MKIREIIENLDALDVKRLNDRRYFARFAHFLFNTYHYLNTALTGANDEENFDGDLHIQKATALIKPYVTSERAAKLYAIADYFSYPANQQKYINALVPPSPEVIGEEDSQEMAVGGIVIDPAFEAHFANVFRTHRAVIELHAGAMNALQQVPALTAFSQHLDRVIDFLENQEEQHGILFNKLKADLIEIKTRVEHQQQQNPPAEGLPTVKAVRHYQKQCDHAMLKAIHTAKCEAPKTQSLVMRVLDAVKRLFKEHIPKLMSKISGIKPVTPLYEYRFFAVRNNSEKPWMKKMEIIAQSHDRLKTPEAAA